MHRSLLLWLLRMMRRWHRTHVRYGPDRLNAMKLGCRSTWKRAHVGQLFLTLVSVSTQFISLIFAGFHVFGESGTLVVSSAQTWQFRTVRFRTGTTTPGLIPIAIRVGHQRKRSQVWCSESREGRGWRWNHKRTWPAISRHIRRWRGRRWRRDKSNAARLRRLRWRWRHRGRRVARCPKIRH